MKASSEDVDLVRFRQAFATIDERQKLSLVIGDGRLTPELDELAQGVATDQRPEALVNQLLKFIPCWCALILLE
jgi:hypothetical protein